MSCSGSFRLTDSVVTGFRWRDEKKREQRGKQKEKLGKKDQPETEKKASQCQGDLEWEGEGNTFRDPRTWVRRTGSSSSCE